MPPNVGPYAAMLDALATTKRIYVVPSCWVEPPPLRVTVKDGMITAAAENRDVISVRDMDGKCIGTLGPGESIPVRFRGGSDA